MLDVEGSEQGENAVYLFAEEYTFPDYDSAAVAREIIDGNLHSLDRNRGQERFLNWAREQGYDGVRYKENADRGVNVVLFDSANFKLSDPVTRDDAGRVIPLSERFNKKSDDIRFQQPEPRRKGMPPPLPIDVRAREFMKTADPEARERMAALLQALEEARRFKARALGTVQAVEKDAAKKKQEALRAVSKDRVETKVKGLREHYADMMRGMAENQKNIVEKMKIARRFANDALKGHPELQKNLLTSIEHLSAATNRKSPGTDISVVQSRFNAIIDQIRELRDQAVRKDAVAALKKIVTKLTKFGVQKLSPERKEGAESVLHEFTMRKLAGEEAIREAILDLRADPDSEISEDVLKETEQALRKRVQDMSTDEIRYVTAVLDQILHAQQEDVKAAKAKFKSDVYRDSELIIDSARKTSKREVDTARPKRTGPVTWNRATFLPPEDLTWAVDGYQEDGVATRRLVLAFADEGLLRQYDVHQAMQDHLDAELGKKLDQDSYKRPKRTLMPRVRSKKNVKTYTVGDRPLALYDGERIALALMSRNEDSARHLTNERGGFKLSDERDKVHPHKITEAELAVINADVDADTRLKKVADAAHHIFDAIFKDFLNETSNRIGLADIATVENYYPLMVDSLLRYMDAMEQGKSGIEIRNIVKNTIEGFGALKLRQPNATGPIILRDVFSDLSGSANIVGLYHGFAEPLRFSKAILRGKVVEKEAGITDTVRSAIVQGFGEAWYNGIASLPEDIEMRYRRTWFDRTLEGALNTLTRGTLSYNLPVAALQAVSYATALPYIPFKYWVKYSGPNSWPESYNVMGKYSSVLWARGRGRISMSVGELAKSTAEKVGEIGMQPIQGMDHYAIGKIWKAVWDWKKDTVKGISEDTLGQMVARVVEKIIRRTQPSFEIPTRSMAARSHNPIARVLMRFSSQLTKLYSMRYRNNMTLLNSGGKPKDFAKWFGTWLILSVVMNAMVAGIRTLRDKLYHRWKADETDTLEMFARHFASGAFAQYGQLVNWASSYLISGFAPSDPYADVIAKLGKHAQEVVKVASGKQPPEKYAWSWLRTAGQMSGTGIQNLAEPVRSVVLSMQGNDATAGPSQPPVPTNYRSGMPLPRPIVRPGGYQAGNQFRPIVQPNKQNQFRPIVQPRAMPMPMPIRR